MERKILKLIGPNSECLEIGTSENGNALLVLTEGLNAIANELEREDVKKIIAALNSAFNDTCPICGNERIKSDHVYCGVCGEKIKRPETPASDSDK
ncbi:hypothetical protein ACYSNR_01105 [Enterococcus sp. LJL128]